MRVALAFKQDWYKNQPVETYARSAAYWLRDLGCEVTEYGTGHERNLNEASNLDSYDFILEIETGRDATGKLSFQVPDIRSTSCRKAVWFIDSHGQGVKHKELAKLYDHVFFAVWHQRGLFKGLKSTWLPNSTDPRFFKPYEDVEVVYDFGFFGSKRGLSRAAQMIEICQQHGWSYDVRQINKNNKHRWPATARAMRACRVLFNRGQKCDGPNQRVLESMAVGRPLITDRDPDSGMPKLFQEDFHYLGFDRKDLFSDYRSLEDAMQVLMSYPEERERIAVNAYNEVMSKHLIKNRMEKIIQVMSRG